MPALTPAFWIGTVLCAAFGEAVADDLAAAPGRPAALVLAAALLAAAVAVHLRQGAPATYWPAVALAALTGAMAAGEGAPAALVAVFLAAAMAAWAASGREPLRWAVVVLCFALGAALADAVPHALTLGHGGALVLFAGAIAVVVAVHYGLRPDAAIAFAAGYLLAAPLGASLSDWLTEPRAAGGAGLGATATTLVLAAALVVIAAHRPRRPPCHPVASSPSPPWWRRSR